MQKRLSSNIKDHIKEVMNMALKTQKAKLVVTPSLLRHYMLELKLMGVLVTVENENELYLDWSESGKELESRRRGSSERLMGSASRIQEKKGSN
jgi:hypothetical protein